jgi:3'-5' exoribonuclease
VEKIFVEQIKERDVIESTFLVRDKTLAMAKNGKPYLTLKLMDRTGEVEGRIWDNADHITTLFAKDDFVTVRGKASVYLGKMQLVIQNVQRLADSEVDLANFLPVSKYPIAELQEKLKAKVATLKEDHFRQMMELFLADAEFLNMYSSAPAAKSMHHVFLGGLLEHSLAVSDLADDVCQRYPDLNRDLLLLGALLHDVGKVVELSYSRSFDYTDEGKLLGHIMLGVEMVDEKIRQIDSFPPRDAVLLKHLLLSHHGQYEYGSPKRPKTLEAIVLNFLDDLDSKMNGVQSHIDKNAIADSPWTSYHRLYNRYFYTGEGVTASEEKPAEAPAPMATPVDKRIKPDKKDGSLGVSLGDRLKGESLDLFSVPANDGAKDAD